MKTLVVVYSRTGRTRGVGAEIARACGNEMREIQDARSRKGFFGFWRSIQDARKGRSPAIQPLSVDVSAYDLVILGAPVWAGHMAAPMRTFVEQNKGRFRHIAVFCTMGGSGAERALAEMAQAAGRPSVAQLALTASEIKKGAGAQKIGQLISAVRALDTASPETRNPRVESVSPAPPPPRPFIVGSKSGGPDPHAQRGDAS